MQQTDTAEGNRGVLVESLLAAPRTAVNIEQTATNSLANNRFIAVDNLHIFLTQQTLPEVGMGTLPHPTGRSEDKAPSLSVTSQRGTDLHRHTVHNHTIEERQLLPQFADVVLYDDIRGSITLADLILLAIPLSVLQQSEGHADIQVCNA